MLSSVHSPNNFIRRFNCIIFIVVRPVTIFNISRVIISLNAVRMQLLPKFLLITKSFSSSSVFNRENLFFHGKKGQEVIKLIRQLRLWRNSVLINFVIAP